MAKAKARLLVTDLEQDRWDRLYQLRTRRELATLGEVIARYEQATDLQLTPRSQRENVNSLRRVIRRATGHDNCDALSISTLDAALARKYLRLTLEAAGPGELDRDTAAVTANSTLTQARSVFSKRARRKGIYDGLNLGSTLTEFLEADKLTTLPRDNYLPPDPALIGKLWTEAEALRATDPEVWLAFYIASMTGLRRGEIIAGRWRWLTDSTVTTPVENDFVPKSGRARTLPVVPDVRREALAVASAAGFDTSPDAHWLPGTVGHKEAAFARLGKWMKSLGWTRKRKSHELRAMFGTVLCQQSGPYAAQLALGHQDLKTTTRYAARPQITAVNPRAVLGVSTA